MQQLYVRKVDEKLHIYLCTYLYVCMFSVVETVAVTNKHHNNNKFEQQ